LGSGCISRANFSPRIVEIFHKCLLNGRVKEKAIIIGKTIFILLYILRKKKPRCQLLCCFSPISATYTHTHTKKKGALK
jgi:hypothetical protein